MVVVSQRFSATGYQGKRVRVSAFLQSEHLESEGELWLGAGAAGGASEKLSVGGTAPWKRYELVMDVPADANSIGLSLTLRGTGTLWADDFGFEQVSNAVPLSKTRRQPENLNFTNSR